MKQRRADQLWCADPGRIEGIQPNLSVLASIIEPPATLLDVGCGIGYVGDWLARHVPGIEYSGIDLDAGAIAEARRLHPGGRYKQGDLRDWNNVRDYVRGMWLMLPDYVFCARVFNHLPDHELAARRLMALAKRKTILAIRFDHEEDGFTRISRDDVLGYAPHVRIVPSGSGPGCRYHTVILG